MPTLLEPTPAPPKAKQPSPASRRLVLFRRLHSLAGVLFGGFVLIHLTLAATASHPATFDRAGGALHLLARRIPLLEHLAIGPPILILLITGIYLLIRAGLRYDIKSCRRGGKLRFFLQRLTALIATAFLGLHLARLGPWAPWPAFDSAHAFDSARAAFRTPWPALAATHPLNLATAGFFLLGILATVYHLANGLAIAATPWNLFKSPAAERRWTRTCAALGISLAAMGTWSWFALVLS